MRLSFFNPNVILSDLLGLFDQSQVYQRWKWDFLNGKRLNDLVGVLTTNKQLILLFMVT